MCMFCIEASLPIYTRLTSHQHEQMDLPCSRHWFRSSGHLVVKIHRGIHQVVALSSCTSGYSAAFYFLSLTLDTIPIGVAYAIWSGVGVAAIVLVSVVVFDQKIDLAGMVGIGLIIAGVVVLRLYSESSLE